MEKQFYAQKMTEAQVNEITELMKGEHGEAINKLVESNYQAGRGDWQGIHKASEGF